ncbi:uncharacterized protein LOC6568223 [Drosophila grimshawi]|uniref:GH16906 n=1 Tax=Drosophila grimshawi TaxID=7222 RepID=B4JU49_DROGR|nr:uncharacterized protein LOC6568223 [Drosophila grimshawi]EDV91019.1 GH16906 [Drosophila grimshawi]
MNNVHNDCVAAQKRRLSDCEPAKPADEIPFPPSQEQPTQPKKRKTEELQRQQQQQQQQQEQQNKHNLLSFCDELLFEIFKYLDTSSILAVMHCSPRFESLLLDHRFWHNIDLSNAPLPLGILEEILGRATDKTHTIKICGPPSSQHVAGEFKQFTCTLTSVFPRVARQLQVLELEGVSLDFEYLHISEFPASLKRLVLKDCSVKVGNHVKSIFHTIEKQLVDLEDLSIEDNHWFEPYYIMALSKLPVLRRLSLKGCQMMCKFVPYGSMAARFGFQKLEVLDLRLTPINNSDLQCFSAIETLRELLLDSPPNLPEKPPSPGKTSNGSGEESTTATQTDSAKMLSDDEPSTSRAAMEQYRAQNARNQESTTTTTAAAGAEGAEAAGSDTFATDNCNGQQRQQRDNSDSRHARHGGCVSSESEDEDTSSTSASSSDKSDNVAGHSNEHSSDADGNGGMQSPLVVIRLPSMARERSPSPAEHAAANVENIENPEPGAATGAAGAGAGAAAGAGAGAGGGGGGSGTPRAYVYLQNGVPHFGQRPQQAMACILEMVDQNWRGNQPAHSRFLPRRDDIIYTDRQRMVDFTRRRRSQQQNGNANNGNFQQVVQHQMFWNMLDPLDREYPRRLRSRPPTSSLLPQYYVSDRAIYSFGRAPNPVQPEMVWIRNANRSSNNRLERIQLCNYTHITNYTLEHLVQCSPNLIYIDVSGTSVTQLGVNNFKRFKPECEVIATHLTLLNKQQTETETEAETDADADADAETDTSREEQQQQQSEE